jgi:hypothetical protein
VYHLSSNNIIIAHDHFLYTCFLFILIFHIAQATPQGAVPTIPHLLAHSLERWCSTKACCFWTLFCSSLQAFGICNSWLKDFTKSYEESTYPVGSTLFRFLRVHCEKIFDVTFSTYPWAVLVGRCCGTWLEWQSVRILNLISSKELHFVSQPVKLLSIRKTDIKQHHRGCHYEWIDINDCLHMKVHNYSRSCDYLLQSYIGQVLMM